MMNDAPDNLTFLTYSQEGHKAHYQKKIEKFDIEVSITSRFSHAMPLKASQQKRSLPLFADHYQA